MRHLPNVVVLISLLALFQSTISDAAGAPQLQALNCSTAGNYSSTDAYAVNLNQLLAAMPKNAVSNNGGFFKGTVGALAATVYGLALCSADFSRADCNDRLTATTASAGGMVKLCPGSTAAAAMFDQYNVCEDRCKRVLREHLQRELEAGFGLPECAGGNLAASQTRPYALVQCTWDLPSDRCKACLGTLSASASDLFAIAQDGEQKSYSCRVRYSNSSFTVVPLVTASQNATSYFSHEKKIGEGAFGVVYEAELKELKIPVAVKRILRVDERAVKDYKNEIRIIGTLSHPNLLPFVGSCDENGELLLVYELIPNGSLDSHLHDTNTVLSWNRRYKIAFGMASALKYLHEHESDRFVLHRDIKPSNVMLDEEFNAKVGDFGLVKQLPANGTSHSMTLIIGPLGYIEPEYINTGKASKASDLYSFGVVLLELASGKRPEYVQDNEQMVNTLVDKVGELDGRNELLLAADPRLDGNYDREQMVRVMRIGLQCVQPDRRQRPSSKQVHDYLTGKVSVPQLHGQSKRATISQAIQGMRDSYMFPWRSLVMFYQLQPQIFRKYLDGVHMVRSIKVNWEIILDIASALVYLQTAHDTCILHRDIKPSNVMLDGSYGAKLGDFGLVREIDQDSTSKTLTVGGTPGYLEPEYYSTKQASRESDIYSFGVAMLQMVLGEKPSHEIRGDELKNLFVEKAQNWFNTNKILHKVDKRLNGNFNKEEMERVIHAGILCVHKDRDMRPSCTQLINHLKGLVPITQILAPTIQDASPMQDADVGSSTAAGPPSAASITRQDSDTLMLTARPSFTR
uniref:Protein kinase domain-containing protein n=1 Tax=Leersia perrieri TaxID=77586 RepID=A0A0D9WE42_9ORYZ